MYARNEVVEATIREMARDLRDHEEQRVAAAAATLDATIAWLEAQLGHSPTARTVAAAAGISVEDVLDARLARASPDVRAFRAPPAAAA